MNRFASARSTVCMALAIGSTLATPRIAMAQEGNGLQPLAIPSAGHPIVCRVLPRDSVVPLRVRYRLQVEIGKPEEDNRLIGGWYDSLGNPIQLVELTTASGSGRTVVHSIIARFGAGDAVAGVHAQGDGTPLEMTGTMDSLSRKKIAERTFPPLTRQEQQHARALVRWLWDHRCHQQTGVP
jgi:hypothetical protein